MVQVAEIKKRLDNYSRISNLPESDKVRFRKVIKNIEIAKRKKENYVSKLKTDYRPNISIPYLLASIKWMKEKGYITHIKGKGQRLLLFLSDEGREAFQWLEDYLLSPLDNPNLMISLNLGEEKDIVANLRGDIRSIDKLAIFSNKYIRRKIVELSVALSLYPEKIDITIQVPAIDNKEIYRFLTIFWSIYWRICKKTYINPYGPLLIEWNLTYEEDVKTYTTFWKEHLRKVLLYKGETVSQWHSFNGEKRILKEVLRYPVFPRQFEGEFSVIHDLMKSIKVKVWIENQLERNPDWFIPHYFWVQELGFKQMRADLSVDSVEQVSPPVFFDIPTLKLPKTFFELKSIFEYIERKGIDMADQMVVSFLKKVNLNDKEFYESWRILRHTTLYGNLKKIKDIKTVFDEALYEYFIATKPMVDLFSALEDYLDTKNVDVVIENIRGGKYRLDGQFT